MRIFSDGQFDVMHQWYAFEPKKERLGSFKKVDGITPDSIALYFLSVPKGPEDYQSRGFTLVLFDYNKRITAGNIKGIIDRKGPNYDYYSKVNYMRRRAAKILEEKKQEMIDARTVVG
jgi:hypothetical protein